MGRRAVSGDRRIDLEKRLELIACALERVASFARSGEWGELEQFSGAQSALVVVDNEPIPITPIPSDQVTIDLVTDIMGEVEGELGREFAISILSRFGVTSLEMLNPEHYVTAFHYAKSALDNRKIGTITQRSYREGD